MKSEKRKQFAFHKQVVIVICIIGLLLIGGKSMAFGKVSLCSEMQGILLNNGTPVANAKVTRRINWHWGNSDQIESTTTNDQGKFTFPAKTASSFTAKLIPHEPVIEQTVMFNVDGTDYEGWIYAKHNYDDLGELQGKALSFNCELSEEPQYRKTFGVHGAYGICQFTE